MAAAQRVKTSASTQVLWSLGKTAGLLKRDESPVRIRHNWLSPVKATPKLPAVVVATVLQNLVDLVVNPMERTTQQVRLQLKDL